MEKGSASEIEALRAALAAAEARADRLAAEASNAAAIITTLKLEIACIAPGSLDTSLSHAAGLSDIAGSHA